MVNLFPVDKNPFFFMKRQRDGKNNKLKLSYLFDTIERLPWIQHNVCNTEETCFQE